MKGRWQKAVAIEDSARPTLGIDSHIDLSERSGRH
jgi:hypothetical protein